MTVLHTSPLLFLRAGGKSSIAGRELSGSLSLREIEMLSFFAEPASLAKAIEFGFDSKLIECALEKGLLVGCDETGFGEGSTWEVYNLQRAAYLMFSNFETPAVANDLTFKSPLRPGRNNFAESFSSLLSRRTERFFTDEAVSLSTLSEIAYDVSEAIKGNDWLSFRILTQGVDGLTPGVYAVDPQTGKFVNTIETYRRKDLLECLHGQWWLNGGGVCWVFTVSLSELAKQSSANPRSYFEMIVLLGAAGQALINSVYKHGLGAWMTPALSESTASKILGLKENEEEALYFFKVGVPARAEVKAEERRSPI